MRTLEVKVRLAGPDGRTRPTQFFADTQVACSAGAAGELVCDSCCSPRGRTTTLLAKKFKEFGMHQMTHSSDGFIAGFPWLITKAREKAYDIHSNYPFLFCLNSLLALTSLTSFFHFVWFAGSGSGEAVAGALWPRRWQLHISHVQGQNSIACTTSCIPHLSPLPSLSS
jgi:hypothetical protein